MTTGGYWLEMMVPLLVLAVSFHGWVQLQRSCVSDPCNTLLLLILVGGSGFEPA
jgi:hypothetical protein